jgi:hypothetical protein
MQAVVCILEITDPKVDQEKPNYILTAEWYFKLVKASPHIVESES